MNELAENELTEIEKLLIELIKIPSVFGREKNIAEFIIKRLKGFEIRKQFVAKERFNIIAVKGKSRKWLVAHMDTVPGEIPVKITENAIFGRGACDNMQSVAASIIVGNKLKDINLLFTVGEEGNFEGAKAAQEVVKGDLIIVQEPTNFQIITRQRGLIEFKIVTKGKQQHSSLENLDSAIHKLIDILFSLKKNQWTCFNIGTVKGGIGTAIVAPGSEALMSVRPENIEEYQDILTKLGNFKSEIEGEIIVINCYKPKISNFRLFPPKKMVAFTEMAFFENSIVFGAGNIEFAHSDNEHILRKDLNLLPKKLIELLGLKF